MGRSPSRKLSAPVSTQPLTKYSLTPSPKKRSVIRIDLENNENGATVRRGTTTSPLMPDRTLALETVSAMVRLDDARMNPKKLMYRAGDPGVVVLHKGSVIGRLVGDQTRSSKKLNLGIKGHASGVSRKHLVVDQVRPLVMRQFKSATNSVSVLRYNPLTKTMSKDYVTIKKLPDQDSKFNLKAGDVLEIDGFVRAGDLKPSHVFRIVDCLAPKEASKRQLAEVVNFDLIDLVSDSLSTVAPLASSKRIKTGMAPKSVMIKERVHFVDDSLSAVVAIDSIKRVKTENASDSSVGKERMPKPAGPKTAANITLSRSPEIQATNHSPPSLKKESPIAAQSDASEPLAYHPVEKDEQGNQALETFARKLTFHEAKLAGRPKTRDLSRIISVSELAIFVDKKGVETDAPSPGAAPQAQKDAAIANCSQMKQADDSAPLQVAPLNPNEGDNQETKLVGRPSRTRASSRIASAKVGAESVEKKSVKNGALFPSPNMSFPPQKCIQRCELAGDGAPLHAASLSPKKGDQFRVLLSTKDTFGLERESWWMATAQKVTRKKRKRDEKEWTLKLEFTDKSSASYVFPGDGGEVQMLERSCNDLFYALVPSKNGSITKKLAFNANPKSVTVGDLVDANYQNGSEHNKWYRGRIAAVHDENETCTIAYEDGDAETGVPIGQHKIVLVENAVDCAWMLHLPVNDDFLAWTKQSKKSIAPPKSVIGSVINIEGDDEGQKLVVIEYGKGGSKATRRMAPTDFVSYVFESLLSLHEDIKVWPTAASASSALSHQVVDEQMGLEKKKKIANRKKLEFREEDWNFMKVEEKPDVKKVAPVMKEMHQSVANSFFRALNNTDPCMGASLLTSSAENFLLGPNRSLGRHVRELLCKGPLSEGTCFPDIHRVEAALKYLGSLVTATGGQKNFLSTCGPSDWSTMQHMLEDVVHAQYAYDGDETSDDQRSWGRMVESLHLSACGAQLLSMLLKVELDGQIKTHCVEVARCREGPFAIAMWTHPDGSRHAVKAVVKTFVSSWIRYGHLVELDFAPLLANESGPSKGVIWRARDEARRMLREFGTFVSYILWLYCTCEGVKLDDRDLAYLVKASFDVEANQSTFDPSVYMQQKRVPVAFLKKIKLRMVLSLDDQIVGPAVGVIAKQLGVEREYKEFLE